METLPATTTQPGLIEVTALYPEMILFGSLKQGTKIKVVQLLKHFDPAIPSPDDTLQIVALDFSANPNFQTYSISGTIENFWPIDLGFTTLKIDSLTVSVDYTKNDIAADFLGILTIFDVDFIIEAKRPAGGTGWFFSGKLDPNTPIKLVDIVNDFIVASGAGPIDVTGNGLNGLQIQQLGFSVDTGTKAYTFDGAASWTVPIGDVESFTVQAALDVARTSGQPATGKISASLFLNDFSFGNLAVTVFFELKANNKELGFILKKGDAELDATLDWGPGQDTILTVQLEKVSVGDILSFLVNLVDPYLDFHLDPPWDILESWQIDNLTLTIDITTRSVSVAYTGTIDLVFMQISKLDLTYATVNGESSVTIELQGTFLGEPLANPMKWDALNDSPPTVPGKGNKTFDLQYLGLGQHVSLATTQGLDTMQEVIAALESTVLPVQSTGKNPLTQLPGIVFNPNSGWLIGAKFVVIDTLEMDLIFNDPVLYGLLIRLFGEKAKIFAGLEFQILYRKVSDTVGVYHIELKLPDEMRNLEFGEVSITLPVIILDIYTNGDFRIDVGFPANGDFSQSFTVQAFPFIGAGGFYFAKLSAETATNLPAIINGAFNPVIEFGIGLQLGVGKDINEGILSAGFSISVEGILEGTIAWFRPTDNNTPTDQYYLLKGALTIVGHVYGTINFAIIQASLDIMVYAGIQAVIEAYQPIYIDLVAGVEVSLSVKVLFITIHLSFSATISEHFAIGSASPTPWILAPSQQQPHLALMAEAAPLSFAERMARVEIALEAPTSVLNWAPLEVWATPKTLTILFQPSYTVALSSDDPAGTIRSGTAATEAKGVALLFVANAMSPDISGAAALTTVADGDGNSEFSMLAQTVLAWAVYASLGGTGGQVNANPTPCQSSNNADTSFSPWVQQTTVTLDQLQSLHDALASSGGSPLFALSDLEALFQQNFCFNITPAGTATSATFFPMFPELSLSYDGTTVDFSANPLSSDYLTKVQQFVQQLQVDYQNSVAQTPGQTVQRVQAADDDDISMATFVFLDYFAILARATVQSAIDYLKNQSASSIGLATLLTDLAPSSTLANAAGMVSRFLLHGLRLPDPSGQSNATSALFELTGQQFTIPTPVPTGFALTLSTRASWIEFTQPASGPNQQPVIGPQLSYPLSPTEIALVQALAAVSFEPAIQTLAPLQLYQLADRRFTFQHTIPWQPNSPLQLCGAPGTSTPTIWPFPDNLLAELTGHETNPLAATPYIGTPSNTGPQGMETTPVSCFAWASYIPVRLKPAGALKNTYLLLGTDEPGRHLLEDLLAYLSPQSGHNLTGTGLSIYLLYPPGAAASSPVSSDMGARGLLLKTNLSTMSTSGQAESHAMLLAREVASAGPDGTPYSATYGPGVDLTQATDFVRLLWECSVVNTGGYYLQYVPSATGAPLPDSLFADGDIATLSMLLVFENANPQPGASLQTDVYRFHNALVVQDEINTSTSIVFATADDITVKTAVVPPGTVGFQMARAPKAADDPSVTQPPVDAQTANIKLDYLYNLLGYQVNGNTFFQSSGEGMPVGPAQSQTASSGASSATWNYNRVVPFYQLAVNGSTTDGENLPPASKNPYIGITQGAQLSLSFTFHDMFGNRTLEQPSAPSLPSVPVGYTDPVIGLSSWPSLAAAYDFSPVSSAEASLNIDVRFDATKYTPGPGQTLAGCLNQAAVDQVAYARIYYQIQQSDVSLVLSTTVDQSAAHLLDRGLFTTLVTDIYSYLSAVLTAQPVVYPVTASPPVTLDTIAQEYVVSGADVAQVNSATANIYAPGTSLTIPCNYRVRPSDSFEAIATLFKTTALTIATDGQTLTTLLRPGAIIYTGTNTTYQLKGGETLTDIANVYPNVTPGDVAQSNADHALTGNMTITIRNAPQPVTPGQKLSDIVNAYNSAHGASQQPLLTAYEIGTTNATTVTNLFQETAPLQIPVKYQIVAGDSLARICTAYGVTLEALLAANPNDTTLLTQGALIPITTETYQVVSGDTLNSIVQRANTVLVSTQVNGTPVYAPITVSDLAAANLGVSLNPQMGPDPNRPTAPVPVPMLVPFALTLPAPASSSNVLHLIGPNDTLQKISTGDVSPSDLVSANQDTLGILSAGKSVTAGGITLTIGPHDTFRTLINRFNTSFSITAQTITNLQQSGVPSDIVQKLTGLQGQVLSSEAAFVTALTAALGAQDTALYLLPLLQYAGVSVTSADLAQPPNTTETGLLMQGQAMLVPPQPLVTSVSIGLTQNTYPAAPIFPVTAQIAISREAALIHPDFADAPEVQSASTLLAPNLTGDSGSPLSQVQFATQFESAFNLKLATGSESQLRYPDNCGPQAETAGDTGDQAQAQHLWAVNLGNRGINYSIAARTPVYFTIAPLATTLLGTPLTPGGPTTVSIDKYTSGQGLQPGGGTPQSFKSIDLGAWATSFLAAVDQFLTPDFAIPAFNLPDPKATQSAVSILDAKQQLASTIANQILPVYAYQPSYCAPFELQNLASIATDTLEQQLLITLSTGYAVDTIVVFGVTVQSTCPNATTAPRFSGRPVAGVYTTVANDSLQHIGQSFAVTMPYTYVAETIQDVQNILVPGTTISGYTVTAGDMLSTIAAQLKTTVDVVAAAMQQTGESYFKANVKIPMAQYTCVTTDPSASQPISIATVNDIAEYFQVTPSDVVNANQNVQGLLRPEQKIVVGSSSYTTQGNDTLADVVKAFGGDTATMERVAAAIATQANLLMPNVTVAMLQIAPAYTISTAKVPLNNGVSYLPFLFTTQTPTAESRVFLDLVYQISELEYDIGSLPGIEGYQDSSWLTFIIPIDASDPTKRNVIGQVDIPVPLRSYPTPPALVSQQVVTPQISKLEDVKQWQYGYTYEHVYAAQDAIETAVRYNVLPDGPQVSALRLAGAPQARNLFEALANFTQVYPDVLADLTQLPGWTPGASNTEALSLAVQALQQMVTEVAQAWQAWIEAEPVVSNGTGADYTYEILEAFDDNSLSVNVTLTEVDTSYVQVMPQISVPGYRADGTPNPHPPSAEYEFTKLSDPAQQPSIPQVTVTMPSLDVLDAQNAWGSIWLSRNKDLSPAWVTNPNLVYQTPEIGFQTITVPLLTNDTEWPVGTIGVQNGYLDADKLKDELERILDSIFRTLLTSGTSGARNVKVSCSYGFAVNSAAGDALLPSLPVVLVPSVSLTVGDPAYETFVDQLAQAVAVWHKTNQPSTSGGSYVFSVSAFSNLSQGANNAMQPLLQVNDLKVAIQAD